MYECVLVMECVSVCSCKCHAITCVFFPAAQPLTGLSLSTGLNECQQHSQQNLRTLGSLCCWMLLEKGFWEVILDFSFLLDKKTQSKWTNELLNQINSVLYVWNIHCNVHWPAGQQHWWYYNDFSLQCRWCLIIRKSLQFQRYQVCGIIAQNYFFFFNCVVSQKQQYFSCFNMNTKWDLV